MFADSAWGKGFVRETRDVTDSARGKGVVREKRDVTESVGRELILLTVQWGKCSFGRD